MLIEAVSDSRNRTVAEVKNILSELGGKWAEPGSVAWAFSAKGGSAFGGEQKFVAKFPQEVHEADRNKLRALIEALEGHDDVQKVYTNAK